MLTFFDAAQRTLQRIAETQQAVLEQATAMVAESLIAGGVWHVFGTGHSHFVAEELYFRAGGLAPVNAILYPPLMQHDGPVTSTRLERMPGLARIILDRQDCRAGEVLTIVSNSGRNAVPVEMAELARERGLHTMAITAVAHAMAAPLPEGRRHRLHELCDVIIDNCGEPGDAAVPIGDSGVSTGPTSSIAGIAIVDQIVCGVCDAYLRAGKDPPVFKTANLPGGDEWNARLITQYGGRVNLR